MATLAFMLTHPAVEDIGINVMAYGQRSQRYSTSQILRHQFCFELRTVTPAPANLLGIVLCHHKHPLIISWVLSLAYFDGAEKMPSPDAYCLKPLCSFQKSFIQLGPTEPPAHQDIYFGTFADTSYRKLIYIRKRAIQSLKLHFFPPYRCSTHSMS